MHYDEEQLFDDGLFIIIFLFFLQAEDLGDRAQAVCIFCS